MDENTTTAQDSAQTQTVGQAPPQDTEPGQPAEKRNLTFGEARLQHISNKKKTNKNA